MHLQEMAKNFAAQITDSHLFIKQHKHCNVDVGKKSD